VNENDVESPLTRESHGRLTIGGELRTFEDRLQHAFHGSAGNRVVVNRQDSDRPLEHRLASRTGGLKFLENPDRVGGGNKSGGRRLHRASHELFQQSFERMTNLPGCSLAARLGNRSQRVSEQIGTQQYLLAFQRVLSLLQSAGNLAKDIELFRFRFKEA